MSYLVQKDTGKLTEQRVWERIEELGLTAVKPVPDRGIDLEVSSPSNKTKIAKIQVKGRDPKTIQSYRWFQLRVPLKELADAQRFRIPAEETWKRKVRIVDFFIIDAVHFDEMWVLTQKQVFELIKLNEQQYGTRPDNVFIYSDTMKGKQKEMNLEARVSGTPIMKHFEACKNNFQPILDFLEK
jgi:hypothetical protein